MGDEADIQWGTLKEDSNNTSLKLYSSFFSEGVEYKLYDNVEVYNDTEEPHIGKIVKLWEDKSSGERKVLIRWFFKNKELKAKPDGNPKEVFLAFGKGKGVTNENELEVICGKCTILCTSEDVRNKQPSPEDLKNADYFFSQIYNVDLQHFTPIHKVVNKLGCHVVYNKQEWVTSINASGGVPKAMAKTQNEIISKKTIQLDSRKRPRDSEVPDIQGREMDLQPDSKKYQLNSKKLTVSSAPTEALAKVSDIIQKKEKDSTLLKTGKTDVPTRKQPSVDKGSGPIQEDVSLSKATLPGGINIVIDKHEITKVGSQSMNEEGIDNIPQSKVSDADKKRLAKVSDISRPARIIEDFQSNENIEQIQLNKVRGKSPGEIQEKKVKPNIDLQAVKSIQTSEAAKTFEKREILKDLQWEDRLEQGIRFGKVLLLQNLDPQVTSADVREMLKSVFQGIIDAQVLPHEKHFPYGQALAIFKTKSFADAALEEMEEKCLVMTGHMRSIIAYKVKEPAKLMGFPGHLPLDKLKLNRSSQNEDYRKAVSTSHCSQPNTIEYEMAMEWRHLQEILQTCQNELFWKQRKELEDLKRCTSTRS